MSQQEDSGIDSEDKQSTTLEDVQGFQLPYAQSNAGRMDTYEMPTLHMAVSDLEVSFRGSKTETEQHRAAKMGTTKATTEAPSVRSQPPNTCRLLQRKLELKVERAKRNYSQYQEDHPKKTQSEHLIPISRLTIPGNVEQQPLVDYKSDDSSEEPMEISFFPAKLRSSRRRQQAELSDTFSIQEMTIDSELDSDDSGSQNLELLPPKARTSLWDQFRSCFQACSPMS